MATYQSDPRWITAKFDSTCAKTGAKIRRGDRVFFFPRERKCYAGEAAEQASRDFEAAASDEAFMSGGAEFGG